MAKRKFMTPVLLSGGLTPGSDSEEPIIGDGSAQTGIDPFPCDFEDWLSLFANGTDLDGDGEEDAEGDWKFWMEQNGFDWTEFIEE